MLKTNLKHMNSATEVNDLIKDNEKVMICCGRMGPMCIPIYNIMEDLEKKYPHVKFVDMEFDHPEASVIRNLAECRNFMSLPFIVYYKNGELIQATTGLKSYTEITAILDKNFSKVA